MIWPATAADSICTVFVADGPATTSSRWTFPRTKKSKSPLWTPTCIFSVVAPLDVWMRPMSRSSRRIPPAACAARPACSLPSKNRRSASPPNFSNEAPFPYATASNRVKMELMMSETSSAPSLPSRARRSDMAVNPEMSTKAIDPSSLRWNVPRSAPSQPRTSLGTWGRRRSLAELVILQAFWPLDPAAARGQI